MVRWLVLVFVIVIVGGDSGGGGGSRDDGIRSCEVPYYQNPFQPPATTLILNDLPQGLDLDTSLTVTIRQHNRRRPEGGSGGGGGGGGGGGLGDFIVSVSGFDRLRMGGVCFVAARVDSVAKGEGLAVAQCQPPPPPTSNQGGGEFALTFAVGDDVGVYMLQAYVAGRSTGFAVASHEVYTAPFADGSSTTTTEGLLAAAVDDDGQSVPLSSPPPTSSLLYSSYADLSKQLGAVPRQQRRATVDVLIFSRDRPYHLDGLLTSMRRLVTGVRHVHVVHRATTDCARDGFRQLVRRHPWVQFHDEDDGGGFRETVLALLRDDDSGGGDATHVVPMVDEIVWTRAVDLRRCAAALERHSPRGTFQLRLGRNLRQFAALEATFGRRFLVEPSLTNDGVEGRFMLYDATLTCPWFCSPAGEPMLNDFWFVTNVDGALLRRRVLLEHWEALGGGATLQLQRDKGRVLQHGRGMLWSHPGELEAAWYALKSAGGLSAFHLAPLQSVLVNNENDSPTVRVDNAPKGDSPEGATASHTLETRCQLFVSGECIMNSSELEGMENDEPHVSVPVGCMARRAPPPPVVATSSRVKIFVYDMPEKFVNPLGLPNPFDISMYASEDRVARWLVNSEWRTLDPDEADLFYVPVMPTQSAHAFLGMPGHNADLQRAHDLLLESLHHIRQNHPFFDRAPHFGRDHVWTIAHDIGGCLAPTEIAARATVIQTHGDISARHFSTAPGAVAEYVVMSLSGGVPAPRLPPGHSRRSAKELAELLGAVGVTARFADRLLSPLPCFDPKKDIVVPPFFGLPELWSASERIRDVGDAGIATAIRALPPFAPLPYYGRSVDNEAGVFDPLSVRRRHLVYFRGDLGERSPSQYSAGVRQLMRRVLTGAEPERGGLLVSSERVGHQLFMEELSSSDFCLCPPGWVGWSPRLFEAAAAGCIPVVVTLDPPLPRDRCVARGESGGVDVGVYPWSVEALASMALPFQGQLPLHDMVLVVSADDLQRAGSNAAEILGDALRRIGMPDISRMRRSLGAHWRSFAFFPPALSEQAPGDGIRARQTRVVGTSPMVVETREGAMPLLLRELARRHRGVAAAAERN